MLAEVTQSNYVIEREIIGNLTACAFISLKAKHLSSSYMIVAGISLLMILSKIVGASRVAATTIKVVRMMCELQPILNL